MRSILFIVTAINSFFIQTTPYDITVNRLEGGTVNLSDYSGKKMVVVAFNAVSPDMRQLLFLDSLYKVNKSDLIVIAVPTNNFGGQGSNPAIQRSLKDSLQLSILITELAPVKKSMSNDEQSPLFKWLTHADQNLHFDRDVDQDGQLYFISEKGTLYALLEKETPVTVINGVLNQSVDQ